MTGAVFSATIEVNILEDAQMEKPHIDYPINDDTYRLADLFEFSGDPTRIRILYALLLKSSASRISQTDFP